MSDETALVQDSVKAAIKERLGNPLVGAFVIAWTITNWEFIAVLTRGDAAIEDKIRVLHADYMSATKIFLIPFVVSVLVTIFYPWLDLLVGSVRGLPSFLRQRNEIRMELRLVHLRKELAEEIASLAKLNKERAEPSVVAQMETPLRKMGVDYESLLAAERASSKSIDELRKLHPNENADSVRK